MKRARRILAASRLGRDEFRPLYKLPGQWKSAGESAKLDAFMTDSTTKPRIALGADHAGYHVKETIKKYLEEAGYKTDDLGTWSEESVDYPDYGKAVGERVARGEDELGIAACGTGMGIAIAANKVPGIRAAVAHDENTARLAREHNNANVLAMGGRVVTDAQAIQIVKAFLGARFAGGRHERRVAKIAQIEAEECPGNRARHSR